MGEEGDVIYNIFREVNTIFRVIVIWRRRSFQVQLLLKFSSHHGIFFMVRNFIIKAKS